MRGKLLSVICLMFAAGCNNIDSVEDRAIIQISGYDYVDEGRIKGTVGIPQYGEESARTVEELNLTVETESLKEFDIQIQNESSKPLSMGKLEVNLYNEDLASRGITDFMDILSRDPRIGRNIYLGIVDGDTQKLIEGDYNQNETTAKYLKGIIENNIDQNLPKTNLHYFLYAYYADGLDGFLPYLKKVNSHIEVSGISIFKEASQVTVIPAEDTLILKLLKEKVEKGSQTIQSDEGVIGMEITDSNTSYQVKKSGDSPRFIVNMTIKGFINEMKETGVESQRSSARIDHLEEEFSAYYKSKAEEMIELFKENETDPIGLGSLYKNRMRNFDKQAWEEQYPEVPVEVNVDLEITGMGISL
ncbi:Ger(x)C family spore germination protein [Halobacillus campisalis]|uniref:Ger(X)C family spore germination protein n=1 Tax=Halobacillus campisalis TaxID=435909 RepID=A0ABW2K1P7_9BACI|nr:Ger(x)C family spore germination protein [Halobacillus campisalis]